MFNKHLKLNVAKVDLLLPPFFPYQSSPVEGVDVMPAYHWGICSPVTSSERPSPSILSRILPTSWSAPPILAPREQGSYPSFIYCYDLSAAGMPDSEWELDKYLLNERNNE